MYFTYYLLLLCLFSLTTGNPKEGKDHEKFLAEMGPVGISGVGKGQPPWGPAPATTCCCQQRLTGTQQPPSSAHPLTALARAAEQSRLGQRCKCPMAVVHSSQQRPVAGCFPWHLSWEVCSRVQPVYCHLFMASLASQTVDFWLPGTSTSLPSNELCPHPL